MENVKGLVEVAERTSAFERRQRRQLPPRQRKGVRVRVTVIFELGLGFSDGIHGVCLPQGNVETTQRPITHKRNENHAGSLIEGSRFFGN